MEIKDPSDASPKPRIIKGNRIRMKKKPYACPKCGAKPTATYLYGYPTIDGDLKMRLEKGLIIFGGYDMPKPNAEGFLTLPSWGCSHCGLEIYDGNPQEDKEDLGSLAALWKQHHPRR